MIVILMWWNINDIIINVCVMANNDNDNEKCIIKPMW